MADLTLAEPALFARLVNGLATPTSREAVSARVADFVAERNGPLGHLVGALEIDSSDVALVAGSAADRLPVSLTSTTGGTLDGLRAAAEQVASSPGLVLAGVTLSWTPGWASLRDLGVRVCVEVARGDAGREAIADIAATVRGDDWGQAALRTDATVDLPWPDETEVATFVRCAIDHDLGFSLTGGLEHAIRTDGSGDTPTHGILNLISCVRHGLNGEEIDELVPRLGQRDPEVLAADIRRMSSADSSIIRAFFTSCATATPGRSLGELAAMGLVAPRGQ